MFVLSLKTNRKQVFWCAMLVLALIVILLVSSFVKDNGSEATMAGSKYSLKAASNEDRVAFLKQFGWEVAPEPLEISEVTIPQTFNKVYENYNQVQKEQGLDLAPYAGRICKQWIYEVENYPDKSSTVRATLLVYKGKVIAGDISSVALNGFMYGFAGKGASSQTESSAAASELPSGSSESLPPNASSGAAPNASSGAASEVTSGKAAEPNEAGKEAAAPGEIPAGAWPTD